ncbi:microcin ABC transporter ATP-binding protein [Mesorhizobium sp. Root554]|uniref:ABC transporter ATP-binding protein n=1 Tax=unclassified Mesorhizobium TaxID=325217 RepID=UPI0006F7A2A4|nr:MULTISPECIES: dipeptide ABC transporter ATP-binding protein [unclassified Mesorhizobium]KQZ13841.1 microcin ABC transporter ATP-binding protein [Mesorhizobium sp. Root1471]KQZ36353.1 microcin ABC transporter ATP-binding protein [Mesorhizobium sp. Root554]
MSPPKGLLQIENLSLEIGGVPVLKDVDLAIERGEVMGLVGESGSGKSMTALTIMQLLPHAARARGSVIFDGIDILAATEDQMCALRGDDIGMVFQEPMTALNPVKTIGGQVAEGIRWHTRVSRAEAEDRARQILDRVGLPEAKFPLSRYPHELSGGQRQRVVIAIACALKPKLLIADEPTTALDVVLQAQILDLLRDLVAENRMGLLLISHDLAVVTEMADRITILRHGEVMEAGETARVLSEQEHPYTRQLAQASMHVPRRKETAIGRWAIGSREGSDNVRLPTADLPTAIPLLSVQSISRLYPGRRTSLFRRDAPVHAVDDVSFTIAPGQSVALVGRSGCGKSTLARMILALDKPSSGEIRFRGETITGRSEADLKPARRDMQVVFQDPYGSFDPRQKVEKLVAEPLHLLEAQPSPAERRDMVVHALREVGLSETDLNKYPHEFSGGQRQRLSIARALITRPRLIVADEPVSALDVSIRAQVLDLFADLNDRLGVAYLFITHDLTVARAITDEVMVMHDGRIVERGPTPSVLDSPRSEAAQALVAAAPDLHRALAKKIREQG